MGNSAGEVTSLKDVTSLLSSTEKGACKYWWRVKSTGAVLYGKFDIESPNPALQLRVASFASQIPSRAAECVGNRVSPTDWIDPMGPPFTAPIGYPCIDRGELEFVRRLTSTVDIVRFEGKTYVHKYMDFFSCASSFEFEIKNHHLVSGSRFVPKLWSIVRQDHHNRGLLLEFIDGANLSELSTNSDGMQLRSITASILELVADLETRGYYPQDLKCSNLVSRQRDRSLFVVDLGSGFTHGMHMRDATRRSPILAEHMLYTLGRTVWELWLDDAPPDDEKEAAPARFPPLIRSLVDECCLRKPFRSVAEVRDAYVDKLRV